MTSAGLLGVWGKWVKHAKYIYNIQDFNPEQVLAVGYTKSKFVTDAMMWFDKFSCKRSDLIITVGRDLVETVEGRFKGKKAPKTVMINNWIDENEIVTMDMGEQIAAHYGLRTINVLTGFKFIGEQIGKLEQQGRADSYVFGFEESYGYLTGSYVRDKDGVDGAYMICEMFSYYATKGISLLDKLEELYKTYGYCLNTLHSYEFDGSAGFAKMQNIMQAFRGGIKEFGGRKVVKLLDYAPGLDGLPKSDVLKFLLEDNCSIVVRPSGTEPKLKTYISVSAENKEAAEKVEAEIRKSAEAYLK